MSRGRRGRKRRTNLAYAIMAIGIVMLLAVSSVAAVLVGRTSGGDSNDTVDDPPQQVTPGAEISRLETQVANDPDDVDSMVVLADVLEGSGDTSDAVRWMETAVAKRPDDAQLRQAFGRILQRQGSVFDAELQLKKAAELDPNDPQTAYYLGLLYESFAQPHLDDAQRWYQKAIDLDPESFAADQARQRLALLTPPTASPAASPVP